MKQLIVYGVGLKCKRILEEEIFSEILMKKDMKVVEFVDGDVQKRDVEVQFMDCAFKVKTLEECCLEQIDYVVVMSKKYFYEIKNMLIMKGVREENILQIDQFIWDSIYPIVNYQNKRGIEIGGPSGIFDSIYEACGSCDGINYSENTVWWEGKNAAEYIYQDKVLGKILISEATDLRDIEDGFYDFVLSSNNLEHIANPLKALMEFCRIIKKGGVVLVAVPVREKTFDHRRSYTPFEHIMSDYKQEICEDDMTHLDEIISLHDYDMDAACGGKEAFIKRAKNNYSNRCLHHHVFSKECLRLMYQYAGLDVIKVAEIYANYVIVGRKRL